MTLIKLLNDTIENKTENYFKEFLHNELWDKYQAIQNIDCNSKNPVIAYETCILESTIQKGYITAIEYQYIKKNGEICWIISEIVPITHKNVYSTLVEKDNTKLLGNISEDDFKDIDIYITLYHRDITDRKRYNTTNKALIDKLYKTIKNKNKYLNVIEDILEFADNKVKDNMNYTKMLIDTIGSNIDVNRCYIFKLEKIVSDNKPMKTMFNLMYCWFDEDGANKDGDCKFELLDNMFVEDIGAYEMYSSLVMDKTFTIKANSDDNSLAYKIWIDNNTKNTLIQPIFDKDEQLIGFIGLDDVEDESREWDSSVYKLLKIAAKSLGNII
jgi:hypothetical protein